MSKTRWLMLGVAALVGLALVGSAVYGEKAEAGKADVKEKGEAKDKAKVELPAAAAAAIAAAFPNAAIEKVKAEDENGVKTFAVKLETEVEVAADGQIVSVSREVALKDVPEAVVKAIRTATAEAEIKEVVREEVRAEAKDGKLVKLDKAKIVFEAELKKGDQEGSIEVAADGTVVEPLKWQAAKAEKAGAVKAEKSAKNVKEGEEEEDD